MPVGFLCSTVRPANQMWLNLDRMSIVMCRQLNAISITQAVPYAKVRCSQFVRCTRIAKWYAAQSGCDLSLEFHFHKPYSWHLSPSVHSNTKACCAACRGAAQPDL